MYQHGPRATDDRLTEADRLRLRDLETTRGPLTGQQTGELRALERYGTASDAQRARRRLDREQARDDEVRQVAADAVADLFDRYDGRGTR